MEQLDSQLPAADATLDAATPDRTDEIVRPGVNLNPADTSYGEQVLQPALRRRQGARACTLTRLSLSMRQCKRGMVRSAGWLVSMLSGRSVVAVACHAARWAPQSGRA
jgi:hypothetical protein